MFIRLLFLFLILILLLACDDFCPPDEQVGKLELTTATLSFSVYDEDSQIIFKNEIGDSLVFMANEGVQRTDDRLCVQELCTEPEIKGETTCEFYLSESERIVFSTATQDAVIDFLIYSDVVSRNTRQFYQAVQIAVSQSTFIEQASILTDSIDVDNLNQNELSILNYFRSVGTLELNGTTYKDVFAYEGDLMTLYFTKAQGLVGFITSDDSWYLVG